MQQVCKNVRGGFGRRREKMVVAATQAAVADVCRGNYEMGFDVLYLPRVWYGFSESEPLLGPPTHTSRRSQK